jgi:hypothetical protein
MECAPCPLFYGVGGAPFSRSCERFLQKKEEK